MVDLDEDTVKNLYTTNKKSTQIDFICAQKLTHNLIVHRFFCVMSKNTRKSMDVHEQGHRHKKSVPMSMYDRKDGLEGKYL